MILDLSKTVVYDFSYDHKKQKYRQKENWWLWTQTHQKANWCLWTQMVSLPIQKQDISKDISEDFEKRFDTSNYELARLLPIGDNEKVIGVMKDELSGKITKRLLRYDQKLKVI